VSVTFFSSLSLFLPFYRSMKTIFNISTSPTRARARGYVNPVTSAERSLVSTGIMISRDNSVENDRVTGTIERTIEPYHAKSTNERNKGEQSSCTSFLSFFLFPPPPPPPPLPRRFFPLLS